MSEDIATLFKLAVEHGLGVEINIKKNGAKTIRMVEIVTSSGNGRAKLTPAERQKAYRDRAKSKESVTSNSENVDVALRNSVTVEPETVTCVTRVTHSLQKDESLDCSHSSHSLSISDVSANSDHSTHQDHRAVSAEKPSNRPVSDDLFADIERFTAPPSPSLPPSPSPLSPPPPIPAPTSALTPTPEGKRTRVRADVGWNETDGFTGITKADFERWETAFPACDIELQLSRIDLWLRANPKRRKSNYPRFITNWLGNHQEKGGDIRNQRHTGNTNGYTAPQASRERAIQTTPMEDTGESALGPLVEKMRRGMEITTAKLNGTYVPTAEDMNPFEDINDPRDD